CKVLGCDFGGCNPIKQSNQGRFLATGDGQLQQIHLSTNSRTWWLTSQVFPLLLQSSARTRNTARSQGSSSTSNMWKKPLGTHSNKRQINQEEYNKIKMKLLAESVKESAKQSTKAKRSNNIKKNLITINQKMLKLNFDVLESR
ncbi:hypothetical protein VP01_7181g1, partial [Puccinia sorghi]